MAATVPSFLKSQICTQASLESDIFQDWVGRLGEWHGHMHRKVWEWCFITQALHERKQLHPGQRGLGFAVGTEPLASMFCGLGASICATDIFIDIAKEKGWVSTNQHASGMAELNSRQLCPDELFEERCTFRYVDMNDMPEDLGEYDFIWSSCALEHLGSLAQGEQFIYNAMAYLKPGGIAVHTTEYNFSSNDSTIAEGGTVLFRKQDLEKIVSQLQANGHKVDLDLSPGTLPIDQIIDVPPYKHDRHLKIQLEQYVTTSVGLIIQKAEQQN